MCCDVTGCASSALSRRRQSSTSRSLPLKSFQASQHERFLNVENWIIFLTIITFRSCVVIQSVMLWNKNQLINLLVLNYRLLGHWWKQITSSSCKPNYYSRSQTETRKGSGTHFNSLYYQLRFCNIIIETVYSETEATVALFWEFSNFIHKDIVDFFFPVYRDDTGLVGTAGAVIEATLPIWVWIWWISLESIYIILATVVAVREESLGRLRHCVGILFRYKYLVVVLGIEMILTLFQLLREFIQEPR